MEINNLTQAILRKRGFNDSEMPEAIKFREEFRRLTGYEPTWGQMRCLYRAHNGNVTQAHTAFIRELSNYGGDARSTVEGIIEGNN